ncbi:MAG: DUF6279 family lipoprotein [Gammaproteobacteria bacterium]|jgi:hypothetical protein
MQVLRFWAPLVATAIVATGCSMARLGYDALPTWAHWQVERYLDLDEAQRDIVGRHVDQLHQWHRRSQLPEYGTFLREVDDRLRTPVESGELGLWRDRVGTAWEELAERLAPGVAELGLTLREEQLKRLRERFADANEKLREQWLPREGQTREEARAERLLKRAEFFLGRLSAAQKREIGALAAALPPTEEAWLAEREARQRGLIRLLEQLRREQPTKAQARRMSRDYLLGMWKSHEIRRGQRIERSIDAGDEFAVRVLAMATPKQREHLSKLLTGFAEDFEALSQRSGAPEKQARAASR